MLVQLEHRNLNRASKADENAADSKPENEPDQDRINLPNNDRPVLPVDAEGPRHSKSRCDGFRSDAPESAYRK
jgi:hypothetical protein